MTRLNELLLVALLLVTLITPSTGPQPQVPHNETTLTSGSKLHGRWRVRFSLSGIEKNLVFTANLEGSGSFLLLDTGLEDTPVPNPAPAVWTQLTNDRVSFAGEAELPIGTCCREMGTLIFKGKFTSPNYISGKLIFVTNIGEEESPYRYHSLVGTFSARRDSDPAESPKNPNPEVL